MRAAALFLVCLAAALAGVSWGGEDVSAPVDTAPSEASPARPAQPAGPDAERIEAAIARGLRWLADQQAANGGWIGDVGHKRGDGYFVLRGADSQEEAGEAHVGVTALAGMAFLASGHLPERGVHARVVRRTLDYMLDQAGKTPYLHDGGTRMYSHAFGVLFLAEIFGMSRRRDEDVARALTASTRFLVRMQNEYGAWRYAPGTNRADLSVTVCQVQAMRAARNVGIKVPKAAIDRVVDYVERSRVEDGPYAGTFYYKIYGTGAFSKTSFAINAAAVTSLQSAGLYDEERYGEAVRFLERRYAGISRSYPSHYYFWYGNYYASQVMRQIGGERWDRWYDRLSSDLLARQRPDGSWPNDTGPGPAFSTAVACLLLAIPKGYLPIFHD